MFDGGRRESDGCISVMENSNDEDPWSPVVLGKLIIIYIVHLKIKSAV